DTSILEDIGLTNAEIKVYLALLELGNSTAGPILDKTSLQNSVVHMTLHKLVEKGFISFIKKGKIKHYRATDPKNIINFIEEKKTRFETILPELLIKQKKQETQEAEIFEGFKGFKNMLYEFIKDANKGDEYLFFSFYTKNHKDFEDVYNFYKEFEKERKRLGIKVKGIAPSNIKHMFKGRNIKNILFLDVPIPMNISIFKNKVIFTPWEDKQVSFMIHSKQLAESFRNYFYSIWKSSTH
ncbi:MAG: helix-turn-helix domain-containing protein, partial [Candidatus Pacearchaeota archaeon]|nr:helix-turn-helix domain-containing protein [Candidatus Pacearchaeota archaeon]